MTRISQDEYESLVTEFKFPPSIITRAGEIANTFRSTTKIKPSPKTEVVVSLVCALEETTSEEEHVEARKSESWRGGVGHWPHTGTLAQHLGVFTLKEWPLYGAVYSRFSGKHPVPKRSRDCIIVASQTSNLIPHDKNNVVGFTAGKLVMACLPFSIPLDDLLTGALLVSIKGHCVNSISIHDIETSLERFTKPTTKDQSQARKLKKYQAHRFPPSMIKTKLEEEKKMEALKTKIRKDEELKRHHAAWNVAINITERFRFHENFTENFRTEIRKLVGKVLPITNSETLLEKEDFFNDHGVLTTMPSVHSGATVPEEEDPDPSLDEFDNEVDNFVLNPEEVREKELIFDVIHPKYKLGKHVEERNKARRRTNTSHANATVGDQERGEDLAYQLVDEEEPVSCTRKRTMVTDGDFDESEGRSTRPGEQNILWNDASGKIWAKKRLVEPRVEEQPVVKAFDPMEELFS